MRKKLDMSREAPPLYLQIKQDIKEKIESGIWSAGEKIPNELDLCKVYEVSRTTVRDAINELVWEEYLIRKRAKGTYVLDMERRRKSDNKYYTYVRSFTLEMKEMGKEAKTLHAEVTLIQADEKIAEELNIAIGDPVIHLKRVRGAGERAVVFFKTYLHSSLKLSLDSSDYYGSLYRMLDDRGVKVTQIKEYLEAVIPESEIQKKLRINPNTPVLKRIRNSYCKDKLIEYTECFYIGDRYRYYVDFTSTK